MSNFTSVYLVSLLNFGGLLLIEIHISQLYRKIMYSFQQTALLFAVSCSWQSPMLSNFLVMYSSFLVTRYPSMRDRRAHAHAIRLHTSCLVIYTSQWYEYPFYSLICIKFWVRWDYGNVIFLLLEDDQDNTCIWTGFIAEFNANSSFYVLLFLS